MTDKRRLLDQLPETNRTEVLKKFFGASIDQLFQPGQAEQLSGYIGEKPVYFNAARDFYIAEPTATRAKYQLEPTMISFDSTATTTNALFYDDLINQLRFQGGIVGNQQRLFETEYYAWAPAADIDKLMNFTRYVWLANPPTLTLTVPKATYTGNGSTTVFAVPTPLAGMAVDVVVKVDGAVVSILDNTATLAAAPPSGSKVEVWGNANFGQNIIGQTTFTIPLVTLPNTFTAPLAMTSDMVIDIADNNAASAWDTFAFDRYGTWDEDVGETKFAVEGVGTKIILVPESIANRLEPPQYTLMERGARDQNPWSLVNRWFHVDSFAWSNQSFASHATRPIISFYRDLKLFNYGTHRRPDIDAVFDRLPPNDDFLAQINLKPLYNGSNPLLATTLNGRFLHDGDRILTLTANDPLLNNRVFRVHEVAGVIHLTLEIDDIAFGGVAQVGDILRLTSDISIATINGWDVSPWDTLLYDSGDGEELRFDGTNWILAQPRHSDQQVPLFDLYDNDGVYLGDVGVYPESTFAGSQLFGFALGAVTNIPDAVLGIPLRFDQYGQIVMENHLVTHRYSFRDGAITGYYYYRFLNPLGDRFGNDWNLVAFPTQQTITDGLYDIPLNLQANPANEEIDFISRNQWFDHFTSIIAHQSNFNSAIDAPFARNHWRDSTMNVGLGTKILQHRAPLLKLMLLASSSSIDFMLATRYAEREYSRYKNKFIQKMNTFVDNGTLLDSDLPSLWVSTILNALKVAKNTQFPFAYSGMAGGQYFIPPTPAFLGLTPLWKPEQFLDDTFAPPLAVIRGHDGSMITAFGDFRDAIILAWENQIYASADASFRTESRPIFDLDTYTSGKYRDADYSLAEMTQILRPMFDRWAIQTRIDFRDNTTFVEDEPFTFNYQAMSDFDGQPVPGGFRGMYRWFYDTERPHSHPWEMLGFTSKPGYWDARYGSAPYTRGNVLLWSDLEQGYVAGGARQGIDPLYARPGLANIVPADPSGGLLDPIAIGLVTTPTVTQAAASWAFGDGGPIEDAWVNSEAYDFALAQASYLMKPARFIEEGWNPSSERFVYPTSAAQWIDASGTRAKPSADTVHGETVDGSVVTTTGLQQWISDYVVSNGQAVTTTFGDKVRGLAVRLGHKMAGFTTTANLQVRADNIAGPLPLENVTIQSYTSPSIKEEIYSAVIVEFTGAGWKVYGYDVLDPSFTIFPPEITGPRSTLSIAATPPSKVNDWRANTYYPVGTLVLFENTIYESSKSHTSAQLFEIKFWLATDQTVTDLDDSTVLIYQRGQSVSETVLYGTLFRTPQEVADFLLGYERYLVSRGWIFDQTDPNTGMVRDWTLALREYLYWIQMHWAPGNFIALSPASAGVKYLTSQGAVQDMEQLINGVYPLLDQNGQPIAANASFVNRLDGEVSVIPRNDNIFAARLFVAEIEHIMLFDNLTIFNDIIYQPLFNLRQPRLRLIGLRSTDWQGRLDAPGFIITDSSLVANFEKAPEDIRTMFAIEQSDNTTYTDYARHVVGYQKRPYLQALMFTDTPQFEFFLGMIQQKGAPGVFAKLLRSDFIDPASDITFFEEWAFRLGDYGATDITQQIEFQLRHESLRRDPQLIQFWQDKDAQGETSDNPFDDRIELIDQGGLPDPRWVVRPSNLDAFVSRPDYSSASNGLPSAGYVRTDEVTYIVLTTDLLTTLYAALVETDTIFALGDRIWVYRTPSDRFDVLRVSVPALATHLSNPLLKTEQITAGTQFTLTYAHGLQVGDLFVIAGSTRSILDFEGVHTVASLTLDPTQIVIDSQEATTPYDFTDHSGDNPHADAGPLVYKLQSVRFADTVAAAITPADGWQTGDLIYIDDVVDAAGDNRWTVRQYNGTQFVTLRQQPKKLDTRKVVNGLIYSHNTQITPDELLAEPLILNRVLCYDPIGGIIPGVAQRELTYMTDFDPAKYNAGNGEIDLSQQWGDAQVGQVWWNLATVRYLETELNDVTDLAVADYEREIKYRIANWGQPAPGTTIDVYEWVKSSVSPAQWAINVAQNIDSDAFSGTVLNADQPAWVESSAVDALTGLTISVFYFWVQNKVTVPANMKARKMSVANVARILTNPTAADLPWLTPVAANSLIVSGVAQFLDDTSTILQITTRFDFADDVPHRQWLLMRPGDASSQPTDAMWRKLRDSLVGRDQLLQRVPDPNLFLSRRFGSYIRPRQSWFENNRKARRAFVEAVTVIFSRTSLVDERPNFVAELSATTAIDQQLIWVRPAQSHAIQQLPIGGRNQASDEWTIQVYDFAQRDALVAATPLVGGERVLVNQINAPTPQWSVWIYQPADPAADSAGFIIAVAWDYHVASIAARDTLVATPFVGGERVLVDGSTATSGFWTLWRYNGATFDLVKAQTYRTADFWLLTDWFATGFAASDPPSVSYPTIAARNAAQSNNSVTFVRVDDDGTGRWIWTNFASGEWTTVAKQNATVALSANLYDATRLPYGLDDFVLADIVNRDGTWELQILCDLLRDSGVMLPVEINELFFDMVQYVHAEQDQVDWAFKTSFMVISNFNAPLDQPAVQPPDETQNLLDFIDEVKPYRVKVRDFQISYAPPIDQANIHATDFDDPPYRDPITGLYRPLDLTDPGDNLIAQTVEPWLTWFTALQTLMAIPPGDDATLFETATVRQIKATLVFDRTSCGVTMGDENAAWRIDHYYQPLPGMPAKNLPALISGCEFDGTVVDSGGLGVEEWDVSGWSLNPFDTLIVALGVVDSNIDGGELDGSSIYDADFDGGKFLQPGGPEERVSLRAFDPVILSIYDNWSSGAPFEVVKTYSGTGTQTHFAIGQVPQTTQAVAVFVDGLRLATAAYTVNMMQRTVTITVPPVLSSAVVIHSFGIAGLDRIVEQRLITGNGTTLTYTMTTVLSGLVIFATVNGVVTNTTHTTSTVSFAVAPASNSLVVITVLLDVPTLVYRQDAVSPGGAGTTVTMTHPSSGTIPLESATIVEVNGLRLASPELHYLTADSAARVFPLNVAPVSASHVLAWHNATPLVVGSAAAWPTVADINLAVTPVTVPVNANIVVVEDFIVFLGLLPASFDAVVMVRENTDWDITGSVLTINKTLALNDAVSITTFVSNALMGIRSETYFGNTANEYPISKLPFNASYMWLTVQPFGDPGGERVTAFTIIEERLGYDEAPWDDDPGFDNETVGKIVSLTTPIAINDIVCWTAMSGKPNHPPIAWRVFADQQYRDTGTPLFEKLRISDGNKTRTLTEVLADDATITVTVNPNVPIAFLPSVVLAVPDTLNNRPGVVWLGAERIEYFSLVQLTATTYSLGLLARGTRGTSVAPVYPSNSLVIDGSFAETFIEEVFTLTDIYDTLPWDEDIWDDANQYLQDQGSSLVEFLLEQSGTYER